MNSSYSIVDERFLFMHSFTMLIFKAGANAWETVEKEPIEMTKRTFFVYFNFWKSTRNINKRLVQCRNSTYTY